MKRIIITLMTIAMATASAQASERLINYERLPHQAQKLIQEHFGGAAEVTYVTYDSELGDNIYDVRFKDGSEAEFNFRGKLIKVEGRPGGSVPSSVLPAPMVTYIENTHPTSRIVKAELDDRTWEVELSDGTEVHFDKRGKLRWYDN